MKHQPTARQAAALLLFVFSLTAVACATGPLAATEWDTDGHQRGEYILQLDRVETIDRNLHSRVPLWRELLAQNTINVIHADISRPDHTVTLHVANDQAAQQALRILEKAWGRFEVVREPGARYTALIATPKPSELAAVLHRARQRTMQVMSDRLAGADITRTVFEPRGEDEIVLRLGQAVDHDEVIGLLCLVAKLEFKLVPGEKNVAPTERELLANFDGEVPSGMAVYRSAYAEPNRPEFFLLPDAVDLSGDTVLAAQPVDNGMRDGNVNVVVEFNNAGAATLAKLSGDNIGKRMAILVDDTVYSAPWIRAQISERALITSDFSLEEATRLATALQAGALPAPVRVVSVRTIWPRH
jgi:preprotein translocase subunit SecD